MSYSWIIKMILRITLYMLAMWLNSDCYPALFFFFCYYLFFIDIYSTQIFTVIILIHIKSSSFV